MQFERIATLQHDRDLLAPSLGNASLRLSEAELELYSAEVEKWARVATEDFQASKIRTLKAEKESLKKLVDDQDAACKTSGKRQKSGDFFTGLHA